MSHLEQLKKLAERGEFEVLILYSLEIMTEEEEEKEEEEEEEED